MGALSDLLKNGAGMPANIAKTANLETERAGYSQDSQDSQGVEPEIRAHLLALAESEGVDAAHVHRLHADDVTACAGESDNTLRAYLRGLDREAGMDAGIVPCGWDAVAHCEGCGPVRLWEPLRVVACPWCFRRKAGKRIPRPLVTCGECIHYAPDSMNPDAGMGTCALGPARAYWPMKRHPCPDMRPP